VEEGTPLPRAFTSGGVGFGNVIVELMGGSEPSWTLAAAGLGGRARIQPEAVQGLSLYLAEPG
jgi:hypothetical protein